MKNISGDILEFEIVGFSRVSDRLLDYIRRNNLAVKIFSSAKTKGAKRLYGPTRMLGEYYRYYYKVECKDKFVDFLVEKFYRNNPNPSHRMRAAFTRILHYNGLHWSHYNGTHWDGCTCYIGRIGRKNKEESREKMEEMEEMEEMENENDNEQ